MSGKVVFLTGGGGVLGQMSAELFAQEVAEVTVIDAVKVTAEETAHRIIAKGSPLCQALKIHPKEKGERNHESEKRRHPFT